MEVSHDFYLEDGIDDVVIDPEYDSDPDKPGKEMIVFYKVIFRPWNGGPSVTLTMEPEVFKSLKRKMSKWRTAK